MPQTGRNDPCPCGSGRKFKKCCLLKGDGLDLPTTAQVEMRDPASATDARRVGLDIHPYSIVKLVEKPSPQLSAQLSPRERATIKNKWSIASVASLDTEDIVARLAELGIDGSRSAFLSLTEGHFSAWSIGVAWACGLQDAPSGHDEDFICLAACEVWKRYCPARPSAEMVDDWMTDGYDAVEAGKDGAAADIWLRVWETVSSRLLPDATTFHEADAVFKISQFFGNWIQDFILAIQNAAIKDTKYADMGIQLTREILDRFGGEDADTILNFRCDLGRLLFLAGRATEGETALQAVIREYPDRSYGYSTLSDQLSYCSGRQPDYLRAIAVLEQALAYPVNDAADWDIEIRLSDLRKLSGETASEKQRPIP